MKSRVPWKPSVKQKKAMSVEINRQIFENVEKLTTNIEALMLWQLHEQLGWGKKRLLKFYNAFLPAIQEMQDYYAMHDSDDAEWLCKYKLREIGIDLDKMNGIVTLGIAYKK